MLTINFFGKNVVVNNLALARVILLLAVALWLAMAAGVVYLPTIHWIIGLIVAAVFVGSVIGGIYTIVHQSRQQSTYPF